jgi:hypothetical protein
MISVGFKRVSKNARVGFVAEPLIVAFRETKVLPDNQKIVQGSGYDTGFNSTNPRNNVTAGVNTPVADTFSITVNAAELL